MRRILGALAVVVLALAGCSDDTEPDQETRLAEAFCADLESGLTIMNILGASVKDGTFTPRGAAEAAQRFAAESCPEQLRTNEGLRTYLEGWEIDPDA